MRTPYRAMPLLIACCFGAASAAERETLTVRGIPTARQVEEFLFPENKCPPNEQYQCLSVRPLTERAVPMDVRFPTGSAELTPQARTQLDGWGKALASRSGQLKPGEIVIEGHADARGSSEYNKTLSEQRAKAVVSHLVARYSVNAGALQAVGRGEESLKDPQHPDSEVNRRVELVRKPN